MTARGAPAELVKATGWMGLALISFTLLAIAARQLLDTMQAFQILFLRSGIGLIIIFAIAIPTIATGSRFHQTRRLPLHLLRNLFHYGGQVCWITAIGLLPLAVVFAFEFTTPIWAALLSALFLGERLAGARVVAMASGFIGILVIARPGLAGVDPAVAIAVAAAVGFGITLTATKGLTRTEQPITILFYMLATQLILGAPLAVLTWQPVAWEDLPWLVLIAACGLGAHYGIARAFQHAEAMVILPMDFLRLPLIAVVGFLLYAEPLDPMVFLGALLIFSGNYYNLRSETRRLSNR
jgi:drug/metabolite transporter (DMT)-like permease